MSTALTSNDLQLLRDMAVRFCQRTSHGIVTSAPCNWLYRNRWREYFDDIFRIGGGVMKVYEKDDSGDPASSINGKIKGLFFMAKNVNGQPPPESAFGEVRLQVPAPVLIGAAPNLYFADFYCMRGRLHYVTLVMTKPGSQADRFCSERLMRLDVTNNPFLFSRGQQIYCNDTYHLLVELFYTEDVDVNYVVKNCRARLLFDIPTVGRGRSTPGGIPKNQFCQTCNLPAPPSGLCTV
jgi:hypothetical protein